MHPAITISLALGVPVTIVIILYFLWRGINK